MPKKTETGDQYIKAATDVIKGAGSLRDLYIAIHGNEPSRQELQRFSNRLNPARSNPGADMLGLCVKHLPCLHDMTLRDFFGIRMDADD
ncbi:hypothetical protein [Methylobacter sp. BlB1]|uniref:hypothetical protein n=1 Tax=Methylobacter sp. BlB1 TaxID=2785914 RepID=UPI0018939971|nr:hypothetical protein [Methylobacter sp. BlB1]MBF6649154.1 hypothetical protein [Methylobacter sp. BlB1]